MISGSLAGPNTIRARTTINRTSIGPMPRIFIAARLCRPHLSSVDYIALGVAEDFVSERAVSRLSGRDPDLSLLGGIWFGDTLQNILPTLRIELGQHVVEQHDRQLADLCVHPVRFGQLQRQDGQALLTARAKTVQIDAVQDEREVIAMRAHQRHGLVDLARRDSLLTLAKARFEIRRGAWFSHRQIGRRRPINYL